MHYISKNQGRNSIVAPGPLLHPGIIINFAGAACLSSETRPFMMPGEKQLLGNDKAGTD